MNGNVIVEWTPIGPRTDPKKGSPYGVWDSLDNVWLGDDSGPTWFVSVADAVDAAQEADVRLGFTLGHHKAVQYDGRKLQKVDTVFPTRTVEQAQELLKQGRVAMGAK